MAATVRTECAGCGGSLWTVLNLGTSPLADYFPAVPRHLTRYPLRMAACNDCGLAQLMDVVDDDELFGSSYGFLTSGSPALVKYYAGWARAAMEEFHGQAKRLTVEIGCNDGTLLQEFQDAGATVLGVDPSAAAAYARERGLDVYRQPFNAIAAAQIHDKRGPAGLITGVNVAAHTQDPLDFLKGVAHLLAEDGVAIFEFQDLAHLVAGCQFDHVYHEHRFFFSPRSFAELAASAGLATFRMLPTPGQGGSVRMYLRKAGDAWNHGVPASIATATVQLAGLQDRAEWIRVRLLGLLEAAAYRGKIAGYAASAKSTTLLNFCRIGAEMLSYVEDVTPSKVGRFTPGTNIPIVWPGHRAEPRTYLIMAWNYLGHAVRQKAEFLASGGEFIAPIPVPVTI